MTPERRHKPRVRLGHLAYIHVEPDSGAIVLDISDGGIGFHAVAPFHQTGNIAFHLSLKAEKRLQAAGEIAWVDKTKKVGGLKFSEVPADLLQEIRTQLEQASKAPTPLHKPKILPSSASQRTKRADVSTVRAEEQSASDLTQLPVETQDPLAAQLDAVPAATLAEMLPPLAASGPEPPVRRRGFVAGLLLGSLLGPLCLLVPCRVQVVSGNLSPSTANGAAAIYFQLGGFAATAEAESTANTFAEKGIQVSVIHKVFLRHASDAVLVGPYFSEHEADAARAALEAEGYTPKPTDWNRATRSPLVDAASLDSVFHPAHY